MVACPNCGKPVAADAKALPFCSERCRLLDLGNWLDERYAVKGAAEEDLSAVPGSEDDVN